MKKIKKQSFKKATFGKTTFQELVKDEHIRFIADLAETKGLEKARLREMQAIYNSLVAIAENQLEVIIHVPNGIWKFDASSELTSDIRDSRKMRWQEDRHVCVTCGHPNSHYDYCIKKSNLLK